MMLITDLSPSRLALATALLALALTSAACGFCNSDTPDTPGEQADAGAAATAKNADKPAPGTADTPQDSKQGAALGDKKTSLKRPNLAKGGVKPTTNLKPPKPSTKPTRPTPTPAVAANDGDVKKDGPGDDAANAPINTSPPATNLEDMPAEAPRPKTDAQDTLDLNGAMTRADIKGATGYRGLLRPETLPGIDADPNYNAIRLKPTTRDKFGVSLQVWREPNPGAQSRKLNDLLRQYPNSERSTRLGDSAFTASWEELHYFVWLDRKNRVIVALTCGKEVCPTQESTISLAQTISQKIKKY